MREAAEFDKILNSVESNIKVLHLKELSVPRARRPPARFCGVGEVFHTNSVCKYFRIEYLKLIDVAIQQLSDRLIDCPGLSRYCELETMLLTENLDEKVTQLYPELACVGRSFQTQLDMFHSLPGMTTETAPTLNACCDVLKKNGACYARYVSACGSTHQASPCQPSIFCDSRTKFQQLASSQNLLAFYLWTTAPQ